MKTVLVVCPTVRDKRELTCTGLLKKYRILFYEYDRQLQKIFCDGVGWLSYQFDPAMMVARMTEYAQDHQVDGITYTEDFPGSLLGAIVAQKLGLIGPDPRSVLGHQHKYCARRWQQKYVPEVTPKFWCIDPDDPQGAVYCALPIFLKPVKSFFSMLANEITTQQELVHCLEHARMPQAFSHLFDWFLTMGSFDDLSARHLIAEQLLHGEQCTVEGFVHKGEVTIVGVTDSIMFPGTISFKRFEYPSQLPQSVQDRIAAIAIRLMTATGFDNSFFNIEFMYDQSTDQLFIIEVNPRAASQFADLYEKVDGVNSYYYLVQLALGKKSAITRRQGKHTIAGSCVLRTFENKRMRRVPSPKNFEQIYAEFPDARIQTFLQEGQLLSDVSQDGKSYRYGLVHLGARDSQELQEKFEYCKRILRFEFESI